MSDEHLRYPIGKFERPAAPLTPATREAAIAAIAQTPANLKGLVAGLNTRQLETTYRPGGWTIRQVVNHVPDSHMNAYIRTKLAVTAESPRINVYDEVQWAEMEDGRHGPPEVSLALLEALHVRWTTFLRHLAADGWRKTYVHPELGAVTLDEAVALYAWHGRHHTAHVRQALERSA
jgi:hypothetical protein